MRRFLPVVPLLLLSGAAAAVDITACHQEVERGDVGVLAVDLDCGPSDVEDSYGVELGNGATLDLAGHTITGPHYAVACEKRCTVVGPGTLRNAFYGIWGESSSSKATVSDVTLASNLGGMAVIRGSLSNVVATDNGLAMDVAKLRAQGITVTGCHGDYCLETHRASIDGLVATGNDVSHAVILLEGGSVRLRNASVTGNTAPVGVLAPYRGTLRLEDSAVDGHATDLFTLSRPLLTDSTCGSSARIGSPPPQSSWGVCTND